MKRFVRDMRRALALLLMPELIEAEVRRRRLKYRLERIFSMDAIEGTLDCQVRAALGLERKHVMAVKGA